ncbi:alpha/beta fold hydrolase [Vibrio salinus]|uniref:alpha/beta fold hydrolase n=1 Tax=Vibrio salinus TaxID=2899784 RepID=UPI001E5C379D|nr:alpha/beta hydrolase [Vibrio salinus]MCE0494749.1 alpha/beta hydrolase [Vibrio salinus]
MNNNSDIFQTHYRYEQVDNIRIFYREAGDIANPCVLLLHGFAASSYMYRDLIPALAKSFYVIAPDLPSFGFTESPAREDYSYTFENITQTINKFTEQLTIQRYAIVVHDYGAPVGWRLAMAHPERISAIISQNGNAYEEGLADGWAAIKKYWDNPSPENRATLNDFPTAREVKSQYLSGVKDCSLVSPDSYTLECLHVSRPGNADIQLDLVLDYASNVENYPNFQAYFRDRQPPLLAVWGKNDPYFLPDGAKAWLRDIPNADIRFYDTGHFALETHGQEIIPVIYSFLNNNLNNR